MSPRTRLEKCGDRQPPLVEARPSRDHGCMLAHPALFDATYEAARKFARDGDVPLRSIPAGSLVLRSVGAAYKGVPATPDSARTIFGGSTADNRWSGARPTGAGVGALYLSRHLDAVSNELFYYADLDTTLPRHPDLGRVLAQDALKGRLIYRFEVTTPLWVADLSLESARGMALVKRLGEATKVKPALYAAGFPSGVAAYQGGDYSFPRALGLAIADELKLADGLEIVTARDEWAKIGETGNNLALFGADGKPVPSLKPRSVLAFGVGAAGQLEQTVTRFP